MRKTREERIRERAYSIWQREGGVHGRHEDHWNQAEREIEAEDGTISGQMEPAMPPPTDTAVGPVGAKTGRKRAATARSSASGGAIKPPARGSSRRTKS